MYEDEDLNGSCMYHGAVSTKASKIATSTTSLIAMTDQMSTVVAYGHHAMPLNHGMCLTRVTITRRVPGKKIALITRTTSRDHQRMAW